MLTLYVRTHCPYCARVLMELTGLVHESAKSESYQVLYVDRDDRARRELLESGGKELVPYLVDPGADVAMYESADIAVYLRGKYAD